ncbi:PAAR domain-containing protein [Photorhabdus khanii subsp. guanajuatensis]|uniref:PAAR domain-containing protein n=2 Tax=Photorhabdus khanii TaxID=1004150 RepID=A0A4R4ITP6_9GAMM|nr:PAAR domain-containing protein [Photorhabdus khanii subsp. guanajuatensis]
MMFTGVIRLGDKLSSGGEVISVSSSIDIEGKRVALLNDLVSCPLEGHGINRIIKANAKCISDGKPIAFDKALCQCGCYVISSTSKTGIGES